MIDSYFSAVYLMLQDSLNGIIPILSMSHKGF